MICGVSSAPLGVCLVACIFASSPSSRPIPLRYLRSHGFSPPRRGGVLVARRRASRAAQAVPGGDTSASPYRLVLSFRGSPSITPLCLFYTCKDMSLDRVPSEELACCAPTAPPEVQRACCRVLGRKSLLALSISLHFLWFLGRVIALTRCMFSTRTGQPRASSSSGRGGGCGGARALGDQPAT